MHFIRKSDDFTCSYSIAATGICVALAFANHYMDRLNAQAPPGKNEQEAWSVYDKWENGPSSSHYLAHKFEMSTVPNIDSDLLQSKLNKR